MKSRTEVIDAGLLHLANTPINWTLSEWSEFYNAVRATEAENAKLRERLADAETQRQKVAALYATETTRHNETWVRMESYRKDLEFAATKLEKAGLLND